jgi:hypothetical protein
MERAVGDQPDVGVRINSAVIDQLKVTMALPRYGFDYENLDFSQLQQYSGPTFTALNGQKTATGAVVDIVPDPAFGQIYHVNRASLTTARPTTQRYTALFVQDEWKLGDSLTIRPGCPLRGGVAGHWAAATAAAGSSRSVGAGSVGTILVSLSAC